MSHRMYMETGRTKNPAGLFDSGVRHPLWPRAADSVTLNRMPSLPRSRRGTWLLAGAVWLAGCAKSDTGFQVRTFKAADGQQSKYSLFVPHGCRPGSPAPLILFLHGSAQAGADGVKPTHVGIGPAVRARAAGFPFFVLFPQASDRVPATFGSWLPGQPDADRALAIFDSVQSEFGIDPKRVYLTGVSVGGNGVWHLAAAYPDRWAAIAPVCGLGPVTKAENIKNLPCWCFHGAADGIVSVEQSRNMIAALRQFGGRPRYTEYPDVGHNSWEKAYDTDEFYTWLLEQKKR